VAGKAKISQSVTVSFEKRRIAFFDLARALNRPTDLECSSSSSSRRDLRYELEALEDVGVRIGEASTMPMGSKSFRITKPFRLLNAAVKSRRR
jgi:hypothetical protein